MAYKGQAVIIPLGDGGIISDVPQTRMPSTSLIEARNVTLANGYLEKHPGSRIWNVTAANDSIAAFQEYYPVPSEQLILVIGANGLVCKFKNRYEKIDILPDPTVTPAAPYPLNVKLQYFYNQNSQPKIVIGGSESVGTPKKAFLFSGGSQVQVIEGNSNFYRPIKKPAADWSASYPVFGLIHKDRLWAFGNKNAQDILYASVLGDQEDFQTTTPTPAVSDAQIIEVATGEGNGISAIFVFKKRLFIVKRSGGLYQLNDDDIDPANWSVTRVNSDFDAASMHGIAQIFDDVLIFNKEGTISSVAASFQLGDIQSSDIFNALGVERYFRQDISVSTLSCVQAVYYQNQKQIYFMYQSKSGIKDLGQLPNRILVMDMLVGKQPRLTLSDKDAPLCLGMITDCDGIAKPCYGDISGHIWEMTSANRQLQGSNLPYVDAGYWEVGYVDPGEVLPYDFVAQTPHLDFGYADAGLANKTKRYDFLELAFQPTGDWNVDVDVYIDSEYKETISYNLLRDRPLADFGSSKGFVLDVDRVDGDIPKAIRKPLHGQGRTISFRLHSDGLSQNIKLQSLQVYFRASDERQIRDLRAQ